MKEKQLTLYELSKKYEAEMRPFSSPLSTLFEQSAIFITNELRILNLETGISTIEVNKLIAEYVVMNEHNKIYEAEKKLAAIDCSDSYVKNVIDKVLAFIKAFTYM